MRAGTARGQFLEEGEGLTEQWSVGTIWRHRKGWGRNSKWGYQVHEWRHKWGQACWFFRVCFGQSNSYMSGIREIDLMWKGQRRLLSGTDSRPFATDGRQSASGSCSPPVYRELVMSVSVYFLGKETALLYTHREQISEVAWIRLSEHGYSSEHTHPGCSAFQTQYQ